MIEPTKSRINPFLLFPYWQDPNASVPNEIEVFSRHESHHLARRIMDDDMIGHGALWTVGTTWLPHLAKRLGNIQAPPIPFTEEQLLAAKKVGHWLILYPGFSIVEMQPRQERNNRFRYCQNRQVPNSPFATATSSPQWVLIRKDTVPSSKLPVDFLDIKKKFELLGPDEIAPPARVMIWTAYAVMSWTAKLAEVEKKPELVVWPFLDDYVLSGDTTEQALSGQLQSVPVTVCSAKGQGIHSDVYVGHTGFAGPVYNGVASMVRPPAA